MVEIHVLMWRWSALVAGLYAIALFIASELFDISMIVGPVTNDSGIAIFTFPFIISRWWDPAIVALLISSLVYLFRVAKNEEGELDHEALVVGLIIGLAVGLGFGLISGIIFSLGFGLVAGLIASLGVRMGFGLPIGLGFSLGFSLGLGVIYGMPYALGLFLAVAVGIGIMFLVGKLFYGAFTDIKKYLVPKTIKNIFGGGKASGA